MYNKSYTVHFIHRGEITMEMRKIRMHGPTRTIALPLSYLRDLGIQDHEYVAVTLEENYIAVHKPGAQINQPGSSYTPSWRREAVKDERRETVSNSVAGSDSPASETDSDVIQ